jgi:N-acetylglucosamine-6-sulfatase
MRTVALLFLALFACSDSGGSDDPGQTRPDGSTGGGDAGRLDAGRSGPAPNIVVIMTDDQDQKTVQYMPKMRGHMADGGVELKNYVATYSLCSPSRASILTGRYPHNHEVMGNYEQGGYKRLVDDEDRTIATWLHEAGYRTSLLGKYINGYGKADNPVHVPAGWDEWHAFVSPSAYDYTLVETGPDGPVRRSYGNSPDDYATRVFARKAVAFIERQEADDERPFFLYVAPYEPHAPATPGPGDGGLFEDLEYPRGNKNPAFNEEDVSDKPGWLQGLPRLSAGEIAEKQDKYRKRVRSLQAVDDLVDEVFAALDAQGELANTIVIFTSDHGFHLGEHRLPIGKRSAYQEDSETVFFIRGPNIAVGEVRRHLVANIDLAPTLADFAGAATTVTDGSSFREILTAIPPPLEGWGRDYLLMNRAEMREDLIPDVDAVRTQDRKYIESGTAGRELYDLELDPHELDSLHLARPDEVTAMRLRLVELSTCSGHTCR